MPSTQKRKRKRANDPNKTPAKRAKKSNEATPKTPKTDRKRPIRKRKTPKKNLKKKKKVNRPKRVRFLRAKVARAIERALVEVPKVPLIYHLFTERDSMGTPKALLSDVLKQLKISNFVKNTHLLRDTHLLSLTKFTTLFAVERDDDYGRLYLKYWPIYDKEAATVYVDNLPEGCNEDKLMRLAKCYGTVAELSIMKKNARWIRPKYWPKRRPNPNQSQNQQHQHHHRRRHPIRKKPLINVGSRPRAFGFIRFVDADSAAKMTADFRYNDPSIPFERYEKEQKEKLRIAEFDFLEFGPGDPENLAPPVVPQELPRQRLFKANYMMRLIAEIRFLKLRRRRRPFPMFMRLNRLLRRFRELKLREFNCLRKAGLARRSYSRRKWRQMREEKLAKKRQKARRSGNGSRSARSQLSTASWMKRRLHNLRNSTKAKAKWKERREREAAELAAAIERGEVPPPSEVPKPKKPEPVKPEGKKKRKRKKMCRKLAKYIPGGQVRRFFFDTQVLSMKRYLELKAEYLELIRKEKERVREEEEAPQMPDDLEFD